MSYIQRSVDETPFCTATISGLNTIPASSPFDSTTAFDTTTANWAVFSSITKDIETSIDTLAFAAFSPNNTPLATFFTFSDAPDTTQLLIGMIRGESDAASSGGTTRGDDVSLKVTDTHRFQYSFITGTETPDTARSVMYMMTIGE